MALIQGVAPKRRKLIYRATAMALASLHSADIDAIGLGKYGRRDNYCKRQVHKFSYFSPHDHLICLFGEQSL